MTEKLKQMERIMTEKLKPCPFCGGEARPSEQVVPNTDIRYWIAICANCAASTPLENWNTRPSVVPEGFKLVPVEPTEAMLRQAVSALTQAAYPGSRFAPVQHARTVWSAMLLASKDG